MADPKGFMTTPRETPARRPVDVRIRDWREVYTDFPPVALEAAGRPVHGLRHPVLPPGLPAGQPHPGVERPGPGGTSGARRRSGCTLPTTSRVHRPALPGRRARAPAVLGINADPVTIKQVEVEIIDRAWAEGWVRPLPPGAEAVATGRRVAVIGSGPSGLAAAQQLTRPGTQSACSSGPTPPAGCCATDPRVQDGKAPPGAPALADAGRGHEVPVRGDRRPGRHGRPAARRFRCESCWPAGPPWPAAARSRRRPGRGAPGHGVPAPGQPCGRRVAGPTGGGPVPEPPISARGKNVIIIGGRRHRGDCLGTSHRQGAASGSPSWRSCPGPRRPPGQPAVAHLPDDLPGFQCARGGRGTGLRRVHAGVRGRRGWAGEGAPAGRGGDDDGKFSPVEGTELELPCELVLLAMGFSGPSGRGC